MKKFLYTFCAFLIGFVGIVFGGCTAAPEKYNIYVRINHARYGTVSGGNGVFEEGQEITIKATPLESEFENSTFLCWLLNNKVVNAEEEYTFEVSSKTAGTYVALFESEKTEYVAIDKILLNTDVDNSENAGFNFVETYLKKIEIQLGLIETVLTTVYSAEIEDGEDDLIFNNETIYQQDKLPYAYDMQETLYGQVILTYEQGGSVYTSATSFNIDGNDDINGEVTTCLKNNNPQDTPDQDPEDPEAEPEIPPFELNKPINDETADKMNIIPKIVIKFERITKFNLDYEEENEETPAE